jgi:STE24 endopeptidase
MAESYTSDQTRQEKAREYSRVSRYWYLAGTAWNFVLLLALGLSGLSVWLRNWAASISSSPYVIVLLYVLVFGVGYVVLTFPLDYYRGYLLPKRYGLVIQSIWSWLLDRLKGGAFGAVIGLIAVEVLYYLLRDFPTLWWIMAALLSIVFTLIMAQVGPILIAPLMEKYTPLEDADLRTRLQNLAARVGARLTGVYTVHLGEKTTRANAMVTGIGRGKRMILVDTLFGRYSNEEIEVVMAHELGHQVHHDVWKGVGVESAATIFTFFILAWVMPAAAGPFHYQGIADVAGLPAFALTFLVVSLALMPLENLYTRWIETEADRFALQTTRNPIGFRSMMAKLADQNLGELDPPRWVKILFYSHPPTGERIRYAEEMVKRLR